MRLPTIVGMGAAQHMWGEGKSYLLGLLLPLLSTRSVRSPANRLPQSRYWCSLCSTSSHPWYIPTGFRALPALEETPGGVGGRGEEAPFCLPHSPPLWKYTAGCHAALPGLCQAGVVQGFPTAAKGSLPPRAVAAGERTTIPFNLLPLPPPPK